MKKLLIPIVITVLIAEVSAWLILSYIEPKSWVGDVEVLLESHFSSLGDSYREKFLKSAYHKVLGWDNKPNGKIEGKSPTGKIWHATYDESGARSDPLPLKPLLIHAYGDSFTHCDDVENDETWSFYLEKKLGYEVKNYGVRGFGTTQSVKKFQLHEQVGIVAPVTILGIFEDNIDRAVNSFRPFYWHRAGVKLGFKPALHSLNADQVVEIPSAWNNPSASLAELKETARKVAKTDYWARQRVPISFPFLVSMANAVWINSIGKNLWRKEEAVRVMEHLIKTFAQTARNAGSHPIVIFFPGHTSTKWASAPYDDFLTSLKSRKWAPSILDVNMLDKPKDGFFVHKRNGHVSPTGNQIIADGLLSLLKTIDVANTP